MERPSIIANCPPCPGTQKLIVPRWSQTGGYMPANRVTTKLESQTKNVKMEISDWESYRIGRDWQTDRRAHTLAARSKHLFITSPQTPWESTHPLPYTWALYSAKSETCTGKEVINKETQESHKFWPNIILKQDTKPNISTNRSQNQMHSEHIQEW